MPSKPFASSVELGWKTVEADTYAYPASTEEFRIQPQRLLLVLVTSGKYELQRRQGAKSHRDPRGAGSLCVVAPHSEQHLQWRSEADVPMRSLHLALDVDLRLGASVPDEANLHDPLVSAGAWALGRALREGAPALYADSVAQTLVTHLAWRNSRLAPAVDTPATPLSRAHLQRVVEYMHSRLAEDVTVDELAAVTGVSKFHFIRMFSATTGLTPYRYLRRMRMQAAAELLRTSTLPVSRIAVLCGYRGPGQFAAAFRDEYGLSPSVYRK